MMKNLTRNWLVASKLTRGIWWILTQVLENLKNLHFNGLLFAEPVDWFLYDSHQKRNEACLSVINMVYTSCLTSCHASFLFWWQENLVKYQNVSNCYLWPWLQFYIWFYIVVLYWIEWLHSQPLLLLLRSFGSSIMSRKSICI